MNPMHMHHIVMHPAHDSLPERLAGVDLNLMVAFDALSRELSVTQAARRVGVTQSAMSHALGRLRQLLGDPLLVRGPRSMLLTPRAAALVVPVRSALGMLGRALSEPEAFEPATARRAFKLSSPDLFDVLAIPPLLQRVRKEAPGVDLGVVPLGAGRLAEQLETGELDAAVIPQIDEPGESPPAAPGLVRRKLLADRMVCLLRKDHPALAGVRRKRGGAGVLSLEAYAAASHAMVSPGGAGPGLVDHALARHGLARRVALTLPHFTSALAIVARSDLVLTAPSALATLVTPQREVVAVAPPLRLPGHVLHLTWHERHTHDAGHSWLRAMLTDAARVATRP
jgi:DNA-binding transcriptional LysR family regulator